jgi:hypothetical protein
LKVVLRQRRSVVRTLGLVADEYDPPVETLGTQSIGRCGTGQTTTHDHERRSSCHLVTTFVS